MFPRPNMGKTATRMCDITRMNPLEFHCSKVYEDRQQLIVELYNIEGIT